MNDPLDDLSTEEKRRLKRIAKETNTGRRGLLKGLTAAGVGGLAGLSLFGSASGAPSTSDSDGDVGTPSNRIDVFADGVDVDDLDVGNADLLSSGDFALIGPTWHATASAISTTSTSYVEDTSWSDHMAVWDDWAPAGATTMVYTSASMDGSSGDVRLRNIDDSENVFEELNIAATAAVSRADNYTPSTTGSETRYRCQLKTDDGGTTSRLRGYSAELGVQL